MPARPRVRRTEMLPPPPPPLLGPPAVRAQWVDGRPQGELSSRASSPPPHRTFKTGQEDKPLPPIIPNKLVSFPYQFQQATPGRLMDGCYKTRGVPGGPGRGSFNSLAPFV